MPNSSCCRINGVFYNENHEAYLKINVISIPEKGKANKELIDFLSKTLNMPKSSISIVSGAQDRLKRIYITGADEATIKKLTEGQDERTSYQRQTNCGDTTKRP